MPMPLAFVFDLDGTLIDSYPAIAASVNHVRALNCLPALTVAEVQRHVGRGPAHLLRQTVPGCDPSIEVARYRAHHPSVLKQGTTLLPGVVHSLTVLRERGCRLGICSNKPKPFTLALLEHLELRAWFDAVIGPEDAARIKPAPDMLLSALRLLDVSGADAIYVGDMVVDIQTARAAGVAVWVIPTGSDTCEALASALPDRLMHRFEDVLDL